MAKIKVQIAVDEELLRRVEAYADDHFTTRSGAFSLAADKMLMEEEVRVSVSRVADALQRIAKTSTISEDDKKEIEAFGLLAEAFAGRPR